VHTGKIGDGAFQISKARAAGPTGGQMALARGGKLAIGGQHQLSIGQMNVWFPHGSPSGGAGDARQ
jgi:hypothetical protein